MAKVVITVPNGPGISPIEIPHNELDGLQGGQSGEYFHLTQTEYNNIDPETGVFVPLSGTESSNPITGDLEIDTSINAISVFTGDLVGTNSRMFFEDEVVGFHAVGLTGDSILTIDQAGNGVFQTSESLLLSTNDEAIEVNSALILEGGRGLTGAEDYSGNITDLDYTQKSYVDTLDGNNVKLFGNQIIDGKKSFLENVTVDRDLTTLDHHAFDDTTDLNISTDQGIFGYCSYDAHAVMNNSILVTHHSGYQSRQIFTGTANMNNTTGYNFQFTHNGTGIVGNLYGINIQAPVLTNTGTITNKYGLLINDFTGGYAIYSAGGNNYFAGKLQHAVGTLNEESALISDITTGTRAGNFTSLRANNLSNQKIPYHISDATGLVDSPIATDGAEVFIGGQTTQLKGYDLEIIKSGTQLLMSDVATDVTNKSGRVVGASYANANNPLGLIYWSTTGSANTINFGGGSGIINAATAINFYTAPTVGTNTGTNRFSITNSLITATVPISGQTPTIDAHLATKLYVDNLVTTSIGTVDLQEVLTNGNTANIGFSLITPGVSNVDLSTDFIEIANSDYTHDLFLSPDNIRIVDTGSAFANVDIEITPTYIKFGETNNMKLQAPVSVFTGTRTATFQDASGIIAYVHDLGVAGSFSGVGTATTVFTVTIGATQPNNTYKVNATPTNLLSAALFYITNKTTTTFDVVYLAGLTGTVEFDWSLKP